MVVLPTDGQVWQGPRPSRCVKNTRAESENMQTAGRRLQYINVLDARFSSAKFSGFGC